MRKGIVAGRLLIFILSIAASLSGCGGTGSVDGIVYVNRVAPLRFVPES